MFHSVGNPINNWYRNWLSVSLEHFEFFCRFLCRHNYRTIQLDEWYRLQEQPSANDRKIIALTFDDGYLDNWVFAFPILKKYNLKGTIFINPEFVDPVNELRPNLEDVLAGKYKMDELLTLGHLNWQELQTMDASGVLDIQSHSMSHNFYFLSEKIIDIYNGQDKYNWMAWYIKPDRKPFSITEDQTCFLQTGYPIFEFGRSLSLRRYFPDDRLTEYAINLFASEGMVMDIKSLIVHLNNKVKLWPGHYETEEEMEARYRFELEESKKILEERLNKKIEFLCWPGGGYNKLSLKISQEAGYKASTLASKDNKNRIIDNSGFYKRIPRFGTGSFIDKNGEKILSKLPGHLIYSYKARIGNLAAKIMLKLEKIIA